MQSQTKTIYQFKLTEAEYYQLAQALLVARTVEDDEGTHQTVNAFLQYLDLEEGAAPEELSPEAEAAREAEPEEPAARLGIFRKHRAS